MVRRRGASGAKREGSTAAPKGSEAENGQLEKMEGRGSSHTNVGSTVESLSAQLFEGGVDAALKKVEQLRENGGVELVECIESVFVLRRYGRSTHRLKVLLQSPRQKSHCLQGVTLYEVGTALEEGEELVEDIRHDSL